MAVVEKFEGAIPLMRGCSEPVDERHGLPSPIPLRVPARPFVRFFSRRPPAPAPHLEPQPLNQRSRAVAWSSCVNGAGRLDAAPTPTDGTSGRHATAGGMGGGTEGRRGARGAGGRGGRIPEEVAAPAPVAEGEVSRVVAQRVSLEIHFAQHPVPARQSHDTHFKTVTPRHGRGTLDRGVLRGRLSERTARGSQGGVGDSRGRCRLESTAARHTAQDGRAGRGWQGGDEGGGGRSRQTGRGQGGRGWQRARRAGDMMAGRAGVAEDGRG